MQGTPAVYMSFGCSDKVDWVPSRLRGFRAEVDLISSLVRILGDGCTGASIFAAFVFGNDAVSHQKGGAPFRGAVDG